MKNKLFLLVSAILAFAGCSQSKLSYFDGHSIFINGNDVYVVGSGCEGTSMTDRPLLWVNGEQQTIGEIGNFNKATSIWVSGNDVYVTTNTEKGSFLEVNGSKRQLTTDYTGEANCVCVYEGRVYVGGKYNGMPTIWIDGEKHFLGSEGCVNKIAFHNGDLYAVGFWGDFFSGEPCFWHNGEKHQLSSFSGRAYDIAFRGDYVYIAGEYRNGAALWENGLLVFCEDSKSCAYTIAITSDDIFLGGNGFDETLRPVAQLWKNGAARRIPEMRDDIYSLYIHNDKLYIAGSSKDALPLVIKDLTCL